MPPIVLVVLNSVTLLIEDNLYLFFLRRKKKSSWPKSLFISERMVFLKSDSKYLIVIGNVHFSDGGIRESFVDSFVSCVLWEWERLFKKCLFGFLTYGPVAVYLFWAVQRRLVQKQMLHERDALHSDCIHPFWWDFVRRCMIIIRLNVQTMRLRSMFFSSSYTYYFQVTFPQNFGGNLVPQESVSKQLLRRSNWKWFWGNWVYVT